MKQIGPTRALAAAAVLGLCGALSGCTVPVGTAAGVSVAEDGTPVLVLNICQGFIDYAAVDPYAETKGGAWVHDGKLHGFATLSLAHGGDGWTAKRPLGELGVDKHELATWGRDDEWASTRVGFTAADLAAMRPGQVRYVTYIDHQEQTVVAASYEEFRAGTCKRSG